MELRESNEQRLSEYKSMLKQQYSSQLKQAREQITKEIEAHRD